MPMKKFGNRGRRRRHETRWRLGHDQRVALLASQSVGGAQLEQHRKSEKIETR